MKFLSFIIVILFFCFSQASIDDVDPKDLLHFLSSHNLSIPMKSSGRKIIEFLDKRRIFYECNRCAIKDQKFKLKGCHHEITLKTCTGSCYSAQRIDETLQLRSIHPSCVPYHYKFKAWTVPHDCSDVASTLDIPEVTSCVCSRCNQKIHHCRMFHG